MEYNMSVREEKYAEVARILAPSGAATGAGAIDAVLQLRSDIGIDRSITELGGEGDLLSTLMEDAMADPVNWSNPRPVDQAGFEAMYSAAW
jgi:alcohol dehydrogenase class IV